VRKIGQKFSTVCEKVSETGSPQGGGGLTHTISIYLLTYYAAFSRRLH